MIVDPQRDVAHYLDYAQHNSLRIRHVFLTHFHADFLAGHLELRDRVGAQIYLGSRPRRNMSSLPGKRHEIHGKLRGLESPPPAWHSRITGHN